MGWFGDVINEISLIFKMFINSHVYLQKRRILIICRWKDFRVELTWLGLNKTNYNIYIFFSFAKGFKNPDGNFNFINFYLIIKAVRKFKGSGSFEDSKVSKSLGSYYLKNYCTLL